MFNWPNSPVPVPTQPTLEMLALALESQRQYFESKFESSEEALRVAMAANDARLHGMNEFRQSLSDQSSKMMSRVEAIATIQAVDARNISEVNTIREKIEAMGKPNWVLLTSVISIVFVMVTGIWLIIGLKMDSTVAPVVADTSGIRAKVDSMGTVQMQIADRLNSLRNEVIANKASLAEIETQFCASDIVRNLMHAQDLRTVSMLWHKAFADTSMPTDNAFYPQVCNRPEYSSNR